MRKTHTPLGSWFGLFGLAGLFAVCPALAGDPPRDVIIDGQHVFPESLSATPDGALYIGSLPGVIYRALPGSGHATPWVQHSEKNGLLSIFGVVADERTQTLWVCTAPAGIPGGVSGGVSALVRLDLRSGELRGFHPLPAPKATCDDIALQTDGTAFIADIGSGEIDTLKPGAHVLKPFARDEALKGIDGIAFAQDGTLYIDNITKNQLLRVDRDARGDFRGLTVLTTSAPIEGPDGFRLLSGHRFLLAEARAGRIDEVDIEGDRASIRVLRSGVISPSAVTAAGNVAYATEGKIEYLFDPKLRGQAPEPFVVRAIALQP